MQEKTLERKPKVSIIIPNYNGKQHLMKLLPSIANQTFTDYEVIIVDDFSTDRSVLDTIRGFVTHHSNMRLIENSENLGFVRTCNRGIRLSTGVYVCLLNNDTEVAGNFIERNVQIMDADPSIGVLSCVIVAKDGKTWFSGGTFKAGLPATLFDDFQGIRSVGWVAGTACFYRREVFDKVGLLDEHFFMYHEDPEFCLRLRKHTDYRVCMFSDRLVTHHHDSRLGASKMHYYSGRNSMLILRRYSPNPLYVLNVFLLDIPGKVIRLVFFHALVSERRLTPKPFLRAMRSSFHMIRGVLDGLAEKPRP